MSTGKHKISGKKLRTLGFQTDWTVSIMGFWGSGYRDIYFQGFWEKGNLFSGIWGASKYFFCVCVWGAGREQGAK